MSIPVFINNFNRLSIPKKLVGDLNKLGYKNVTILDNNSGYPPLAEWYEYECPAKVIPLYRNLGQLALYNSNVLNTVKAPFVVYTDSDIELNSNTPEGFIEKLIEYAEKYHFDKAGLSLRLDDLPDNQFTTIFKNWEAKYWAYPLEDNVFSAEIDTTFHVMRMGVPFHYKAIRVAGDFTSRHLPWYTDFSKLDQEEQYYLDNVSTEYSGYRRYYDLWLKEHGSNN